MEVKARKHLRHSHVQVGCMQEKSETRVSGPIVRVLVDGQWPQIELDVTDIAKAS